jgi:hypothetical protein
MDSNKKLTLNLTVIGAAAMTDLLSGIGPRGRVDLRNHAKLFKQLNTACRKFKDGSTTQFELIPCTVELTDPDLVGYFKDILLEKVKEGVPGNLSEGYVLLLDVIDTE